MLNLNQSQVSELVQTVAFMCALVACLTTETEEEAMAMYDTFPDPCSMLPNQNVTAKDMRAYVRSQLIQLCALLVETDEAP